MSQKAGDENDDDEGYVPFVSAAARRREKRNKLRKRGRPSVSNEIKDKAISNAAAASTSVSNNSIRRDVSLLDVASEIRKREAEAPDFALKRQKEEEARLLETVTVTQKSLLSAKERAEGVQYTEAMQTGWVPKRKYRKLTQEKVESLRKKWHIIVQGDDVPPPVKTFKDMRFPAALLEGLAAKGITRPTPIQLQGLPVALSGRDMIGIAFTGSGKTICFTLPMITMALGEEMKLPAERGEGPFGLAMGPSRELQRQTYEIAKFFAEQLHKGGHPLLRITLAIGGEDKRAQLREYREMGTHIVVATPGRLNDFLSRGSMNLDLCKYLVLDEADRMIDLGFDEEVQKTLGFFKSQRQMLLFSATMPKRVIDFAQRTLVKPAIVNVGRAGAANLDVIQEVEYVKKEAKIVYLLECLQKTPPPVLIFCERKPDVDDIHEYLLLKGVDAVAVHGGKSQAERNEAIAAFKQCTQDVLVATDVAAKGLDFPDIKHVINFDMPSEIENYVHRIGRTGRGGKTGVATTFINLNTPESAMLDLKHLLVEAKQRIPPVLMTIADPQEESLVNEELGAGCSYCGGLGHRIGNCPKLEGVGRKRASEMRDVVGGAAYGGNW